MTQAVDTVAGQQWTLRIVAPGAWLTANSRLDRRYVGAKLTRAWRLAAWAAARQAGLPTGIERVRIDCVARFRGRAPIRDRDNLRPTVKAVVDGLGPERRRFVRGRLEVAPGWGLVVDDSDKHVDGPELVIGERIREAGLDRGHLLVTITVVQP